jgi:hypothetical protein
MHKIQRGLLRGISLPNGIGQQVMVQYADDTNYMFLATRKICLLSPSFFILSGKQQASEQTGRRVQLISLDSGYHHSDYRILIVARHYLAIWESFLGFLSALIWQQLMWIGSFRRKLKESYTIGQH